MNPAFERFLAILDLEQLERDLFRGANPGPEGPGRLFGGQVAGQAMQAAAATVEADHDPHSLHASFMRPGRRGVPVIYQVDRIRDGRSFTTRRVVAVQQGEAIFSLTASFHVLEESPEHQLPLPPNVPPPDQCEREDPGSHHSHHHPFDIRELEPPAVVDGRPGASTRRMWVRTDGRLPDESSIHASVVAFLSDMGPVGAARRALRRKGEEGDMMGASLDHTLWFHRPLRADEWLLYDLEAVAVAGARGLSRDTLSTEDGLLVASVAQEVLLRPIRR